MVKKGEMPPEDQDLCIVYSVCLRLCLVSYALLYWSSQSSCSIRGSALTKRFVGVGVKVQHALKKSDAALETLNRAIGIDPKNPLCKFHRASILFANDKYKVSNLFLSVPFGRLEY